MSQDKKLIETILNGTSDANIQFDDLCHLLRKLGFVERIRGSHHIYNRTNVEEIINIQPKGSKAKSYQVKQIRNIILKHKLTMEL